jgi:hypothetical protein
MPAFDLETFAENGILRENSVREAFASFDWEKYRNKTVHIRGCAQIAIPTWAFVMATAYLSQVAKRITFGEDRDPMPIFAREQAQEQTQS